MKKAVSFCILLFWASNLYSQGIKFSFVPAVSNLFFFQENSILHSTARFGAGLEADYLFNSEKKIRFGLGVGVQNNHVRIFETWGPSISMSNIRAIITSFKFESYYYVNEQFYVSIMPSIDYHFKHSNEIINDQTGLSLSFGLGNNIKLKDSYTLCIEPRFTIFDIIPFKEKNVNYSITTTGLRIGLIFGNKKN